MPRHSERFVWPPERLLVFALRLSLLPRRPCGGPSADNSNSGMARELSDFRDSPQARQHLLDIASIGEGTEGRTLHLLSYESNGRRIESPPSITFFGRERWFEREK
jgi:hypothetical protein